ncbi:metal ABC transporter permease [Bacteriovorax sp. PP10]|uniref:Metal ABC transporter permease n=1 Tax=Bacteriovorax antarcticus TaxID=3088717 RepID=A0ABU5VWQ4_9BACT|nr:metal ABC transporter permease [Bacteriovorax sp. PP10]MEA9356450.1 metal ABC transporter permease [Bacteriovorax sp. PP10]
MSSMITDFFQYDFLLYALLGTIFLALTCGLISPLIIARKNAFMGAAISHSTLLGLAISMSLFEAAQALPLFVSTLLITIFLTLFLAYSTFRQKLPNDSMIGIFYTSTMALGIIIHTLFAKDQSDLLSFLFGNILLLTVEDLYLSFGILLITALVILIPLKKWLFLTFDEEGAITSGIKAQIYHYTFFVLLAFLIVTSIKLAGTVLVETLLLVPGFFALKFSKNIVQTFVVSTIFSTVMAIIGIVLANAFGLPSGATLAVVLFTALVISLFIKRVYNLLR